MSHASGAKGGDINTDAATVRYQVADVDRAIAFYTQQLGFRLEQKTGSAFASVSYGNLRLILSGPGSSGSRPLPDGRAPGAWRMEQDRNLCRRSHQSHRETQDGARCLSQ